MVLRGQRFETLEELEAAALGVGAINKVGPTLNGTDIQSLPSRWQKVVDATGQYFENI